MRQSKRAPDCHPDRANAGRGLCYACYNKEPDILEKKAIWSKTYYIQNKEKITVRGKLQRDPNRENLKVYFKEYHLNSRKTHPLKMLLAGAKSRAKKRGHEFSITQDDIKDIPQFCPVLGYELLYGNTGKLKPESASLDRFDNSKGYVPGNIRIISMRANGLKSNGTLNEFSKLIEYLKS